VEGGIQKKTALSRSDRTMSNVFRRRRVIVRRGKEKGGHSFFGGGIKKAKKGDYRERKGCIPGSRKHKAGRANHVKDRPGRVFKESGGVLANRGRTKPAQGQYQTGISDTEGL